MTYTIAEGKVNKLLIMEEGTVQNCRVSWQNKFVKLVNWLGFIKKNFVTIHGHTNIKFVNAKQAKEAHQYRNTKENLYKTNATIKYNKICKEKQLTPKYISNKINGKNSQCQKTIKAATQYCLNQELRFLYVKKQKLNERVYRIRLECASSWQKSWHNHPSINW